MDHLLSMEKEIYEQKMVLRKQNVLLSFERVKSFKKFFENWIMCSDIFMTEISRKILLKK